MEEADRAAVELDGAIVYQTAADQGADLDLLDHRRSRGSRHAEKQTGLTKGEDCPFHFEIQFPVMLPQIGIFKAHSSHARNADLQIEAGADLAHRFVKDADMLNQKGQRLIDQHMFDLCNGLRRQTDLVRQAVFAAV